MLSELCSFVIEKRLPTPDVIVEEYINLEASMSIPYGLAETIQRVVSGYYDENDPLHLYILFCVKEYPKLIEGMAKRSAPRPDEFPILQKFSSLISQGRR